MGEAEVWLMCRVGFVETARAIGVAAGAAAVQKFKDEWSAFTIVEVDQRLVEEAAVLAIRRDLRSLDSLHLAAAVVLPAEGLAFISWDNRLRAAAHAEGIRLLPEALREDRAVGRP